MTYPSTISGTTTTPGPTYNYSYDAMYRPSGMTDTNNNTWVSGVTYNAANQMLTGIDTRTNNRKISSMYNAISGETVTYTYDSLNRLATASGSGWSETYGFDPFGNLTTKTGANAPGMSLTVSQVNNQVGGVGYDANGNATSTYNGGQTYNLMYDVENHISGVYNGETVSPDYAYDAQNRRNWIWAGATDTYGDPTNFTVNVYMPGGQKLGAYTLSVLVYFIGNNYVPAMQVTLASSDKYFGSRRVGSTDQLGSNYASNRGQSYFPWGEPKGSTNPQDTWNFATYWADSATGLDYANNRYYSNAYGRFMTPDPYGGSGKPSSPGSWNRYAYTRGDPVNRLDPGGRDDQSGDDCAGYDDGYTGCIDVSDFDFVCEGFTDASSQSPGGTACGGLPSDACVGADGFTPSASPYCQYGGPPPDPTPVSAPPTPSCSISLYERPAGGKHRPWQHTYIVIDDPFLQQSGYAADELILQAGPSNNFPIGGTLQSQIVVPGTGYGSNKNNASNPVTNKEIGVPYTGANACLDVLDLLGAIANYNDSKQVPYMAVPIPFVSYNSNSFTSTLLNDVGLSFGSPGFAPGWGPLYGVPGLVP